MVQLDISVEYCASCAYLPRALWLAGELLTEIQSNVARFVLVPGDRGVFEWSIGGEVVFSKVAALLQSAAAVKVATSAKELDGKQNRPNEEAGTKRGPRLVVDVPHLRSAVEAEIIRAEIDEALRREIPTFDEKRFRETELPQIIRERERRTAEKVSLSLKTRRLNQRMADQQERALERAASQGEKAIAKARRTLDMGATLERLDAIVGV